MILIFCYGSNLPHKRLINRIGEVKHIGIFVLDKYHLVFNKKSTDGSAKANIKFTNKDEDIIWGVVIEINEDQKKKLDKFEGKGKGYNEIEVFLKIEPNA